MDTKHTPGPWHWVNPETDEPAMPSANSGYGSLRTVEEFGENKREEKDGKFYTSFRLPKFILNTEEIYDEDARLIAAAPDLLQCVIDAIPHGVSTDNKNIPDSQVIPVDMTMGEIRRMKAAFKKATQP